MCWARHIQIVLLFQQQLARAYNDRETWASHDFFELLQRAHLWRQLFSTRHSMLMLSVWRHRSPLYSLGVSFRLSGHASCWRKATLEKRFNSGYYPRRFLLEWCRITTRMTMTSECSVINNKVRNTLYFCSADHVNQFYTILTTLCCCCCQPRQSVIGDECDVVS